MNSIYQNQNVNLLTEQDIKYFVPIKREIKVDYEVLLMVKEPELKCTNDNGTWYIELSEDDVSISMYGDTEEDAYIAFWDYIYDLIPDLEKEQKLSKGSKKERDILRTYFKYIKRNVQ